MENPSSRPRAARRREPYCTRRVFGFFLAIGAAGFGWSLWRAPARLDGAARDSAVAQAYAACRDSVRQNALEPSHLRFPDEPESADAESDTGVSLASSVTATPKLGAPYTQHFTCRAARVQQKGLSVWRVTRMAMDLPVS